MVSEMSEAVQFLFVTHNKATMEAAQQLSGVTMREPGVSRLVSVDLAEAARLAGAANLTRSKRWIRPYCASASRSQAFC
jgi:chromosome segregation protein